MGCCQGNQLQSSGTEIVISNSRNMIEVRSQHDANRSIEHQQSDQLRLVEPEVKNDPFKDNFYITSVERYNVKYRAPEKNNAS
jgi:hypothetical protein